MLDKYFSQFIRCHNGLTNRFIHIVGFALIGLGIIEKSLPFVLLGGTTQELGHFYQYAKTRKREDSPLHCLKSQSIFAYPVFIMIIVYVLLAK